MEKGLKLESSKNENFFLFLNYFELKCVLRMRITPIEYGAKRKRVLDDKIIKRRKILCHYGSY